MQLTSKLFVYLGFLNFFSIFPFSTPFCLSSFTWHWCQSLKSTVEPDPQISQDLVHNKIKGLVLWSNFKWMYLPMCSLRHESILKLMHRKGHASYNSLSFILLFHSTLPHTLFFNHNGLYFPISLTSEINCPHAPT